MQSKDLDSVCEGLIDFRVFASFVPNLRGIGEPKGFIIQIILRNINFGIDFLEDNPMGCNDWEHLTLLLKSHEESKSHLHSMVALITKSSLIGCWFNRACVEREAEFWVKILRRIVAIIKLLASQGLAFH
ncbi:hypothetical protein TNCV_4264001 [Trichonephila clavipes]|nr:hypothetical protein TNCV_4264001 [Trichonephila clavipes]